MSGSEEMILGLLHLQERSAYDVKKALEKLAAHYFAASFGSIVPSLHRLEEDGSARVREEAIGKRKKKIYSITKKGRMRFERWMKRTTDLERDEDALLMKIFFFGLIEEAERRAVVLECCQQMKDREKHLRQLRRESRKQVEELSLPPEVAEVPTHQLATVDFGIAHYKFMRNWLEKRYLS